jgi:thiamine transport system substrate-binding protein
MKPTHFYKLLLGITLLSLLLTACSGTVATITTVTPTKAKPVQGPITPIPTVGMPGPTASPTFPAGTPVLNVMTHDSFAASDSVILAFEQQNHVKVNFIKSGDAGAALNKAILSKNAPLADVFYGVDNTFLSRALASGIYETYNSPILIQIQSQYRLDPSNQALPVDHSSVCLTYDKAYFAKKNLALPQSFEDLLKPLYKGLLVVENPATSSPGLAFLLASIAHFGADKYLDFWKSLKANGLVVVDGWETAYYTNFSGSSGKGSQPLVVSYNTDPAAEVVYSATPITQSPVGSILSPQMCFQEIEYVGILKGTKNLDLAHKFVDFMLGVTFQEDMPLQMYVEPVNSLAKLPAVFQKYVQEPSQPAKLSLDAISQNRDTWIKAWTTAVLK